MTKEMRELLARIEAKKVEARSLMAENKLDEAERIAGEIRDLNRKVELQKQLETEDANENRQGRQAGEQRDEAAREQEYRAAFLTALRGRPVSAEQRAVLEQRAMSQGVPEDGGLIVPEDVSTRINELRRSMNDLSRLITVEPVTTLSGSRVLEKEADMTAFFDIAELQNLNDMDNPKFASIAYACKARGGILPVSNTLLQDTDQNLMGYLTRWIAKKQVFTRNGLIITQLKTLTPKALADLKAVKKVFNVDLDPAISANAVVLTNQDGFNWLDEQVDGNGRFLLQDDITRPGGKVLYGRPVAVAPNKLLASIAGTPNKAPLFIGDLTQLMVLFDRRTYEILATNVGGDAFKRNTTDIRVITREDLKGWDTSAAVYGQLALS